MRALVTGGTGFIGANLTRTLLKKGYDVALLVRRNSSIWRIEDVLPRCILFESDMSDTPGLSRIVREFGPDVIFHLAAYGAYPGFQNDAQKMTETNVAATQNLMEAADAVPLINAGSSSEYGIKDAVMSESSSCEPDNPYGISKLAQTKMLQSYGAVTLRLFHVYGPWEEPSRLVPTLLMAKLQSLPLRLMESVRDFIYVADVIGAFILAVEKYGSLRGSVINIGSGRQTGIRQLIDILDTIDPTELEMKWDFKPIQTEPLTWYADIRLAKKLLEWSPRYDVYSGLKESYRWWKVYLNSRI